MFKRMENHEKGKTCYNISIKKEEPNIIAVARISPPPQLANNGKAFTCHVER
jgi:hypothetical protein